MRGRHFLRAGRTVRACLEVRGARCLRTEAVGPAPRSETAVSTAPTSPAREGWPLLRGDNQVVANRPLIATTKLSVTFLPFTELDSFYIRQRTGHSPSLDWVERRAIPSLEPPRARSVSCRRLSAMEAALPFAPHPRRPRTSRRGSCRFSRVLTEVSGRGAGQTASVVGQEPHPRRSMRARRSAPVGRTLLVGGQSSPDDGEPLNDWPVAGGSSVDRVSATAQRASFRS